jgi:hypothetical protein
VVDSPTPPTAEEEATEGAVLNSTPSDSTDLSDLPGQWNEDMTHYTSPTMDKGAYYDVSDPADLKYCKKKNFGKTKCIDINNLVYK